MRRSVISLIIATLLFANAAELTMAESYKSLPQPVWSQKPNADYIPARKDIFFVPGRDTLYIHIGEERASETKVWSPDTLRAVDPVTGKIKWVFSFAKPGYGWPSTEDPFVYAPDGTVYAYFSSEHLLYSVSPEGKEKWSKKLSSDILYNGKLHLLSDGTLIIAAEKSTKIGSESVQFIGFDKNGKQRFNKVIAGKLRTVTKTQLVVEVPTKEKESQKVEVFSSSLRRAFQYTFPKGAYVNFYTTFALSDGTIIFSVTPKPKTTKLIALSPSGKVIWGRSIEQLGFAFQAGSGYMVFNYKSKKLSYFNQKGLVSERILSDFTMLEGDSLPSAYITADGKLFVDLLNQQYVLDPETLSTINEFKLGVEGYILDYRNNSVVVYYWEENRISKHVLK
ncbi:PQQ-like domain-containing protein [Paenibacillus sophorae]|uniref:PQQ-binding-like beta-propeller repeat protein n=1 Tax=Paenibacillus sophorae TaxID=1333845 RepID=A0A1H8MMM4_9BACL|nr:PQQ-binding-like beta-propeller repeat protein [Paenibacillus sophorae]QWU17873.1 PQQ-binding-like beta-propeller repeat protein [Paenibacillus sophorae]SEO18534.1 PQQ-like domain-containing protein [Paenibacillus sophorae]